MFVKMEFKNVRKKQNLIRKTRKALRERILQPGLSHSHTTSPLILWSWVDLFLHSVQKITIKLEYFCNRSHHFLFQVNADSGYERFYFLL